MSVGESRAARALRRLYVASGLQSALPHGLKTWLRRMLWLPVARASGYPISTPRLPRPSMPRDRSPLRLGRALMACDLNPDYIDYWPSTRRAWLDIVGVEPLLVLIAEDRDIPDELRFDEYVVPFTPIEGIHTALQAQCLRLLFPALVETADAVLISDIDLYPLRASYFTRPIGPLDARHFVSYRDVYLNRSMVSMLFNAATPSTWRDVFGVSTMDEVRAKLAIWTSGFEYDGRRAWPGWYTDQKLLYTSLTEWPEARERWWMLDDDYTQHDQLDRLELENEAGLEPRRRAGILKQKYSEYVCLFPYAEHRGINDLVLELALEATSRRNG